MTIDPVFIPWHDEQVIRHGLSHRVGGVVAIKADLPRFMRAFTDANEYAAMRADFVRQVRPLLERGCDVLIPAGGLPMLLFAQEQPFVIDGAVVLEGIATVMKATEMAISMHRLTGWRRAGAVSFARASVAAIADFQGSAMTRMPLPDAEQRRDVRRASAPFRAELRQIGLATASSSSNVEAAEIGLLRRREHMGSATTSARSATRGMAAVSSRLL